MSSPAASLTPDSIFQTIQYLRSPLAIRERCGHVFNLALDDNLEHFRCHLDELDGVADYVIAVMKETYPNTAIPFHSRWRHFEGGTPDRLLMFQEQLQTYSRLEQARIKIDLAVVSVLLDAGAGNAWRYTEPGSGFVLSRSEGLAIASFHLFCSGAFSSNPDQPLQVDADGLRTLNLDALKSGFQISANNPLVGLEGRLNLLHNLSDALVRSPHLFSCAEKGRGYGETTNSADIFRPGYLLDYLMQQVSAQDIPASLVLSAVLEGLSSIWPGRVTINHVNLGDVWPHPALPDTSLGSTLIPFHKLSQWLTYSLLEPLEEAGLTITELDSLTGLPEYRNGGLFIDLGVLQPKHAQVTQSAHSPDSSMIVEWRSLTVILLDHLAQRIRQQLGLTATQLPLACVLQGGTWSAGRRIAGDRRPGGVPPIQITSDGTVF